MQKRDCARDGAGYKFRSSSCASIPGREQVFARDSALCRKCCSYRYVGRSGRSKAAYILVVRYDFLDLRISLSNKYVVGLRQNLLKRKILYSWHR